MAQINVTFQIGWNKKNTDNISASEDVAQKLYLSHIASGYIK